MCVCVCVCVCACVCKVLNLPPQSLQQEIELTEDLMELFIDYQVPSDLLMAASTSEWGSSSQHYPTHSHTAHSNHEPGNATDEGVAIAAACGVDRVRENVKKIQVMLHVCVCVCMVCVWRYGDSDSALLSSE